MTATAAPSSWQRTLWLMVALQAIMSLAFSVSGPFLPLYIGELGVRPTSQVELWAGIVTSSNALTAALFSPLWGALADRVGRKAMVVRSTIAACVFNALMGLSHNVWQLLGVRALSGVFGGFSVAAIALVGTQVPEEYLGFSLGWMATGQLAGTLFGPLVGGLLADRIHDYRAVFFWTSAGTLVGALFCATLVHEHAAHEIPRGRKRMTLWEQFRETARHPSVLPLFTVIVLAQISARGLQPVIPLLVQSLIGNSPWLATAAGASLAITGIADFLASPWLGKRSDTIGYRRVMMICLAGTACFTLPQAIARNIWLFLALRFGVGVFLGGVIPSANAWIGRLFPREQRAGVYGITASATFLGLFLGPLVASTAAAHLGFAAMFLIVGLLTLGNLLYVAVATRRL